MFEARNFDHEIKAEKFAGKNRPEKFVAPARFAGQNFSPTSAKCSGQVIGPDVPANFHGQISRHGCPWQPMVGHGQPWLAMSAQWPAKAGYGKPWLAMAGHAWQQQANKSLHI